MTLLYYLINFHAPRLEASGLSCVNLEKRQTLSTNFKLFLLLSLLLQFCTSLPLTKNTVKRVLIEMFSIEVGTQLTFTCSNPKLETLEKGMKYAQI